MPIGALLLLGPNSAIALSFSFCERIGACIRIHISTCALVFCYAVIFGKISLSEVRIDKYISLVGTILFSCFFLGYEGKFRSISLLSVQQNNLFWIKNL